MTELKIDPSCSIEAETLQREAAKPIRTQESVNKLFIAYFWKLYGLTRSGNLDVEA